MGRKWMLLAAEAVTLTVGIAIGALGMNIWWANAGASQTGAEGLLNREEIRVRVNDGMVQWFDGMKWNEVSSVEALQQEDRFYLAKAALEEFEQQYREQKMVGQQAAEQQVTEQQAAGQQIENQKGGTACVTTLHVGVKKKEPAKTTITGTQSTQAASGTAKPQVPVASQPQTSTPDTSNDNSSDDGWSDNSSSGDSSGDSSDNSSAETPAETPAEPPAEQPAEAPAETPADDSAGDGENMDWSDDYL